MFLSTSRIPSLFPDLQDPTSLVPCNPIFAVNWRGVVPCADRDLCQSALPSFPFAEELPALTASPPVSPFILFLHTPPIDFPKLYTPVPVILRLLGPRFSPFGSLTPFCFQHPFGLFPVAVECRCLGDTSENSIPLQPILPRKSSVHGICIVLDCASKLPNVPCAPSTLSPL